MKNLSSRGILTIVFGIYILAELAVGIINLLI